MTTFFSIQTTHVTKYNSLIIVIIPFTGITSIPIYLSARTTHIVYTGCVLSNPHLNKTNKISKCADLNLNWQIKCLVLIPKILRRFNYKIFYILRILLFCKFYVSATVTLFTIVPTLLVRLESG